MAIAFPTLISSHPTAWTRAWTAPIRVKRSQDEIDEYACHHANVQLAGTIAAARAAEKSDERAF